MSRTNLQLAERTVPRYTSYPTAPQFTAAVGPDEYAAWLEALPADATLSAYLHVPFCEQLCNYCGCHTKAVRRPEPVDVYAGRLAQEIELAAARAGGRPVIHVHWGGGTPSILGEANFERIVSLLSERFDLSGIREHAIELDPRHVTPALVRTLAACGINRASLGVQDLSPEVQRAIGRIQPFEMVERSVSLLRDAGIENINIDLMYGLPHQTARDVERNAALAASLQPQRFAVFGYAHVPWFKKNQRLIDEAALPDTRQRLEQAETVHATLQSLGYVAVGLDHYARADDELAVAAKSGRLRRNFQGYTTDQADALIGLGASSIGHLPSGFVQNAPDMAAYARAMAQGRFATVKGIAVSAEDRLRGAIIERLMCDLAVDLDAMAIRPGRFDEDIASLAPLAAEGIVHIEGRRITVPQSARALVRLVASAFDRHLRDSRARHSLAV